ncbi:MAG: hypothetical protein ACE5J7_01875 [Candidatus Aenigmatarchaeota archaeon]
MNLSPYKKEVTLLQNQNVLDLEDWEIEVIDEEIWNRLYRKNIKIDVWKSLDKSQEMVGI